MAQYIDKAAVVAKIDDWRDKIEKAIFTVPLNGCQRADAAFEYEILGNVRDFIDAFEVKGADLEKEIKEVQRNYKTIEEYEGYPCTMYADGIEWIAKHFFELGLKAKEGK